jgi:hypothetical protein
MLRSLGSIPSCEIDISTCEHFNLSGVCQETARQVVAHAATALERARLWDRWRSLDKNLDGYARRRSTRTAVVVVPLHLNWSQPYRQFKLSDRDLRARLYEIVLREGEVINSTLEGWPERGPRLQQKGPTFRPRGGSCCRPFPAMAGLAAGKRGKAPVCVSADQGPSSVRV